MLTLATVCAAGYTLRGPASMMHARSSHAMNVQMKASAYDFSARDLKTNEVVELSTFDQKVSLAVNVASA